MESDINNLLQVKVLKLKDLNDGTTESALRLEYNKKIALLDSNEIDGLIKSLKNLQAKVFTSTRDTYTEVTFMSRAGFETGAYYDTEKGKANALAGWTGYMSLLRRDNDSTIYNLNTHNFATFLNLVEQAKTKM
ncbi:MAG: hypothetical protein A2Y62_18610 [Candidatus Fischerbacteria bacterium RBG_13_37_8]|uniref:Uncharacterized protein n=1 Tax=Candidatus Fischerbacteria bacterium RBG_13_37_8 TaxID=1817863 RepID=A0A1F5V4J0_9BACT|nr:MAG: hypothetical protein A2Y62_18610 [Candidatus Fischerbacteria bacterium RBG_13_37_8]